MPRALTSRTLMAYQPSAPYFTSYATPVLMDAQKLQFSDVLPSGYAYAVRVIAISQKFRLP